MYQRALVNEYTAAHINQISVGPQLRQTLGIHQVMRLGRHGNGQYHKV